MIQGIFSRLININRAQFIQWAGEKSKLTTRKLFSICELINYTY